MAARHTVTKDSRGFTLVELLVVIVVLGILSMVTVFAVRGITARAEDSSCAADKKTLEVALATYQATVSDGAAVTEQDIVDAGFLRSPSEFYDVVAGDVAAAPANKGNCP